jgi:prepilin-type N-terminal cleavage/methylation domain-containing protein
MTTDSVPPRLAYAKRGFTLIELSIVLVIIGLVLGGILVGRDMINSAEVRATIGQIEKYNSAVNTFRSKYNGLPGDLTPDKAAAFGFTTRVGTTGRGDGDGFIGTQSGDYQNYGSESAMFWNDLSFATLIDGNFTTSWNTDAGNAVQLGATLTATTIATVFPAARMSRGNFVTVGAMQTTAAAGNYWLIAGIYQVTSAYAVTTNITPNDAYNMDVKLDDGMPETGIVQAHGTAGLLGSPFGLPAQWSNANPALAAIGDCVTTGASGTDPADTYNRMPSTGGNAPACIMRFRFN